MSPLKNEVISVYIQAKKSEVSRISDSSKNLRYISTSKFKIYA